MAHRHSLGSPLAATALIIVLSLGTSACAAKVNQDVFDQEIARIHGDIDGLDTRVSANRGDIEAMSRRLDDLQVDLEQMREDFDVAITRLENGLRFATPVHFDFDRAELRSADLPLLDRFAEVVGNHYEGATVTVEGFADPAGSAAYNRALSERRAESVAAYLQTEGGLFPEMFRVVGYGEDRQVIPGAQGPGDAGLENRRVTFVIEYAPGGGTPSMTASAEG